MSRNCSRVTNTFGRAPGLGIIMYAAIDWANGHGALTFTAEKLQCEQFSDMLRSSW
ncbi:MAG: hypothetical protein VXZ72_03990 [Chlamydiota bacterium]|nr:hypothetical protein [Chlamydiota bacterium]